MRAREHAERFLAACPEDVRAAVGFQAHGMIEFGRDRRDLPNIVFATDGSFQFWVGDEMSRTGHIDRLLSNYPREVSHDPA